MMIRDECDDTTPDVTIVPSFSSSGTFNHATFLYTYPDAEEAADPADEGRTRTVALGTTSPPRDSRGASRASASSRRRGKATVRLNPPRIVQLCNEIQC